MSVNFLLNVEMHLPVNVEMHLPVLLIVYGNLGLKICLSHPSKQIVSSSVWVKINRLMNGEPGSLSKCRSAIELKSYSLVVDGVGYG